MHIFVIIYLIFNVYAHQFNNRVLSYIEKKTITLSEFNSRVKLIETIKKIRMGKFQKIQVLNLLVDESIIKEFFKKKKVYFEMRGICIKIMIKYYIKREAKITIIKSLKTNSLIKYLEIKILTKNIIKNNNKQKLNVNFSSIIFRYNIYYSNNFFNENKKEYIFKILDKKKKF